MKEPCIKVLCVNSECTADIQSTRFTFSTEPQYADVLREIGAEIY